MSDRKIKRLETPEFCSECNQKLFSIDPIGVNMICEPPSNLVLCQQGHVSLVVQITRQDFMKALNPRTACKVIKRYSL